MYYGPSVFPFTKPYTLGLAIHKSLSIIPNSNKILRTDWLSTVLISALIGQCNRTVRVMHKYLDSTRHRTRALKWLFSLLAKKTLGISCVLISKKAYNITNFVMVMINW